jgi:hypothetical protein
LACRSRAKKRKEKKRMSKKSRPDSGSPVTRREREKRMKSAYYAAVKYHEELGEPFEVEYTKGRRTLTSRLMVKTFKKGTISNKGMNFIKTIKRKIIKNEAHRKIPKKTREELGLQYLFFNKEYMGQSLKNVIELDLTAAYWDAAYKMGIIDKADYYHGLSLKKTERLAALGSLARVVKVRKFDGKKYLRAQTKDNSEQTRHVWFAISNEIDKVMRKCAVALKDQLVFYWIDALFFIKTGQNKKLVSGIIKKAGYQSKFVKIEEVHLGADRARAWSMEKGEIIDKQRGIPMRFFAYDVKNDELFKIWKKK